MAQPAPQAQASPSDAARALGVTFGGPAALATGAAMSALSALGSIRRGRLPSPLALLGLGAAGLYAAAAVPWMRRWGSTAVERRARLPGDEVVPAPGIQSTRAVTVGAPPEEVWPWLAQVGQDRGGFYSYEWLENLAGCRMRNADRVHPEWQHREIGEEVMMHPARGAPVVAFTPGRALVLKGWGAFVLEPADDGGTRLLARNRVARGAGAAFYAVLVELPHFVMERRMLLGIKHRAERARTEPG